MGLHIIILAAGKGKRMVSTVPKVLHKLGGVPLLERVVNTALTLKPQAIHVVYGNGGSIVRDELDYLPVQWIEQKKQLGTGHAVAQALPACKDHDQILILYGDVPLISSATLNELLAAKPTNGLGMIVTELTDPTGFGRIIRNEMGHIVAIVEHKDATPIQREIKEINTGILTASCKQLKGLLPKLKNKNKQKEYYLTDVIALAVAQGFPVGGVMADNIYEVAGVNDRWQLVTLERCYQQELAKQIAYSGVTIMDPARLDIRGPVKIETDVIIDVNVIMEGKVVIGKGCKIGPNVMLKDVEIGNNVQILANSVIEDTKVHDEAVIGPFARVRPGCVVEKNARVGNFVEMKKTKLGPGSKVPHLTYLGDTTVGKNANIGAGTITCNYDGVNKWSTHIGDYAFIGSNTSLVAPVKIGAHATIGAGSTITQDAPANQLTLCRAQQHTSNKWVSPRQKKAFRKDNRSRMNSTKVHVFKSTVEL